MLSELDNGRLWRAGRLLVLTMCVAFDAVAGPVPAGTSAAPKIHCAQRSFDFGKRMNTQVVRHTFSIANRGDAPLLISKVSASCGCTVATVSSRNIAPGKTATLAAKLDLKGRRGVQKKSITITSNDKRSPAYRLWLTGTAQIEIGLEPTYVNFGQVTTTNALTKTVKLLGRDPDIEFLSVSGMDERTQASIALDSSGKRRRLRVTVLPPFDRGFRRTQLTVRTSHPRMARVTLPVSLIVPEPIRVIPRRLAVRGNYPGGLTRALLVRPGTVRTFDVLGVDVPVDSMTAEIRPAGRGNYRIIVRGIPATNEINGKQLIVRTDVPGRERISIPITFTAP